MSHPMILRNPKIKIHVNTVHKQPIKSRPVNQIDPTRFTGLKAHFETKKFENHLRPGYHRRKTEIRHLQG